MKIFQAPIIEEREQIEVTKDVYTDIPKGSQLMVNTIQYDYYGKGNHRYFVICGGTNWAFKRNEIKPTR